MEFLKTLGLGVYLKLPICFSKKNQRERDKIKFSLRYEEKVFVRALSLSTHSLALCPFFGSLYLST